MNRNPFSRIFKGATVGADATIVGNDNVFGDAYIGVDIWDNGYAQLNFNDFINQVHDIEDYNGPSNLSCTWWGNASGPRSLLAPIPATVYTPSALGPIAGTSHTGCTP